MVLHICLIEWWTSGFRLIISTPSRHPFAPSVLFFVLFYVYCSYLLLCYSGIGFYDVW